jgi:hypothetical protein
MCVKLKSFITFKYLTLSLSSLNVLVPQYEKPHFGICAKNMVIQTKSGWEEQSVFCKHSNARVKKKKKKCYILFT